MEEFERKVKRLENSYREVKQENKGIKEYLFILSSVLAVVIILLIVAVQFTGHSIIDFSGGSLSNVVSETSFSHVAVGTDAPYSQTYGETGYGLVAYYSFDGDDMGGSLSAKDSYYSNYDGSYTGDAAVTSTGCVYGRCATFDGAGDYINLPNTGFPSGDGTISISAWVYPSGNDMAAVSLALASGDNNNRHLGVFTHQNNWFASHWGGDWDTGQAFTPNAWQLITYTYDGTSESFYYNGALVGSRAYASNYAKDRVWLGGWDDTVGNFYYLNGKLDEVMIFNHSLSADQVTAIYTNASNRFVSTQGNHTFTGINLGTNDTANITLGDYIISAGTSIQAQINDGEVGIFVDGVITDYSLSGDLGSATLKLIYNTDANRFFSPIAGESITIDAWVSVVADTTFPSISISSPTNTTYTSISLELNYTASDETALGSCWYSQDLGVTNVSFVGGCGNNASLTASEGSNTWTVWVNDTSNNVNSSSITFGVDTTAPTITVTSPGNITYNTNNITINFTSSDSNGISASWFYNGTGNTTYTDIVTQIASEGSNTWILYSNDTSGNTNSSSITFGVDTITPEINFTAPTSSGTITSDAIYVNLTTSDTNEHYSFVDFDNSLVGWWRGENNANDENGAYNASWVGTSIYSAGKWGRAFSFNRTNGYVNTSNIFDESTFSASVWFKASSLTNGTNILNNGFYSTDTSTNGINKSWQLRLGWSAGDKVFFCVSNSTDGTCLGNSTNHAGNSGYLFANNWYHVVVTYDGSSGNTSLYLNGVVNWTDLKANMVVSTEALTIGKDTAVSTNTIFNGSIDDVIIFNKTLTSAEVASLYSAQSNKYSNNFTGLAVGSHTIKGYAVDSAGNKNQTETRTVTLEATADTTFPSISIIFPSNITYITTSLELNYTASDETALGSCWYSQDLGVTNVSFVGGCGNNASLTASEGSNTWTVWVNDTSNNVNSSSITFGVDTTAPTITVTSPGNITYNLSNSVTINFTSSDETAISSRWFYNGTGNTTYTDVVIQVLADGQYTFIFYTNDSSNNVNSTNVTFVVSTANTGLSSCLSQCTENEGCVINDACHLDSSMCSGSLCQFNNLTLSAQIKTGTDSSGNALNLNLNITSTASSPVLFLSGGAINFSGSAGSVGGNASIVNITVYNLFNTTNAFFYGTGGASSTSAKGGNGGILQINAHGIVRWFSDQLYGLSSNSPRLTGGASNEGTNGTTGTKTFNKDLSCTSSRFRDVDISDDGAVNSNEPALIAENYNNLLGEEGYVEAYDISCDDKLNVVELSRIGLNYNTR